MFKITILTILFLVSLTGGLLYSTITYNDAINIVLNNVVASDINRVIVYSNPSVISGSIQTVTSRRTLTSVYPSNWVFFIDDIVFADWGHPCRYVFVNSENGEYQVIHEYFYPENLDDYNVVSGLNIHQSQIVPVVFNQIRPSMTINPRLYAILVGFDGQYYWNNISSMFCLLTQKYGFDPANIIVLCWDGLAHVTPPEWCPLDLDGDNDEDETPDIDYASYRDEFNIAFSSIADLMSSNPNPELNQFFFYYSGHGFPTQPETGVSFALSNDNNNETNDAINVSDLSLLLDSLPECQQVIGLTQCYSGGFVSELSAPNRIIITPAEIAEESFNEVCITGYYDEIAQRWYPRYNEFFYYFTAAVWGWYPSIMEAWSPWVQVGDFNFMGTRYGDPLSEFFFPNHPPDVYPDNEPFGNCDGIVQLRDAYNYSRYYDIRTRDAEGMFPQIVYPGYTYFDNTNCYQTPPPPTISLLEHPIIDGLPDLGQIMTMSGIAFKADNNRILSGNILLSEEGIEMTGGILNIAPNSVIYLPSTSRITIRENAILNICNNVTFIGANPTSGDTQGNRIEVYGNLVIEPDAFVTFSSEPGHSWDGLYLFSEQDVTLSNVQFTNCNLYKQVGDLSISTSSFDNAKISAFNGDFLLENCPTVSSITCGNCPNVIIKNNTENTCTITGNSDGIRLKECVRYEISGYNISNNAGCGIEITESYGLSTRSFIKDCTIVSNSNAGIRFYHSNGLVEGCIINGNNKGIVAFRSCNVELRKNPETQPYFHDSSIYNNIEQEILFDDKSDIKMDNGRNIIGDSEYIPGTFDQNLVQCSDPMTRTRSYRLNKWCNNSQGISIMPDPIRFVPSCLNPVGEQIGYTLEPLYDPGIPREVTPENDEVIYYSAINEAMDDNIAGAIMNFKMIISQYPESEFAPASAKHLLSLEQDKLALKNYYATEPNLHWNGEIDKLADYLENYCNIKMGDYQAAIAWFESIISDPPSELDSLMAVIDLGYVYLLMQENTPKAPVYCIYPQFIPSSQSEYELMCDSILSSLFSTTNHSGSDNYDNMISPPSRPILYNNYPNPFNPSTTISFLLDKESSVDVIVYNIKGQKIKTLAHNQYSKGKHSINWNGLDDNNNMVGSGIYLYELITPNSVESSKMMFLK
jgi:tetratricopeptide (TPR) repeat protein